MVHERTAVRWCLAGLPERVRAGVRTGADEAVERGNSLAPVVSEHFAGYERTGTAASTAHLAIRSTSDCIADRVQRST